MKLEITQEQFELIWDEIIRLEEQISFMLSDPDADTWDYIFTKDHIDCLKEIVENEYIDI